jgi:predicted XRE-type DNA-binding protein
MNRKRSSQSDTTVVRGSANVYADLGLPAASEMLTKAHLVFAIERAMRDRDLTQTAAAVLMGVDQPKVSHLLRGRFRGFSTQRLLELVARLGVDVDIVIHRSPSARRAGRVRVSMR